MAATSPDLLSEGTGWHGEQHIPDLCQSFVQTSETTTNPPESTRDFNQVKSDTIIIQILGGARLLTTMNNNYPSF